MTTETMLPPTPTVQETPTEAGLKWWVEAVITVVFYIVYSMVRNQFGSALGGDILQRSFDNAIRIIDLEKALGLYHEEWIQEAFIDQDAFIVFWNAFYGSFHFGVTIFAMVWLFVKFPQRYMFMRSTLAATTGVALIGFAYFPLMPPRLLNNCESQYGACETGHEYIDTLVDPGGLWNFENGPMESISNQYAAMPSLHIAWAAWCTVALFPVLKNRWGRLFILSYPFLTLFAIVVTANHYWFDAVGGLIVLGLGLLIARPLSKLLPGRVLVDEGHPSTLEA
ncbi:MAG: phosphatase PAP2 family protein [Actinomycetota bacterium]